MKNIILCSLLIAICLLSKVQGTCKGFMGRDLSVGEHYIECIKVTCNPDGSISQLGCSSYRCAPGKEIGYRERDTSKPYPQCCEGPICAD